MDMVLTDEIPPTESIIIANKVVLIDMDNCPSELAKILKNLKLYKRVIICYGGQIPKIPLNFIYSFAEAINDKKLDIIGMTKKGKNAADFGLCFLAGRLSSELPTAEFLILSNDTDLDHAINMLTYFGHQAERIGTKQENTGEVHLETVTPSHHTNTTELAKIVAEYAQKSLVQGRARPGKTSTLLNSIRAFCHTKYPDKETEIFNYLRSKRLITVLTSGVVQYSD